ncbi:unannotated protein [freshwater metagenome]|uniref:Unannotated protein n=1 Tax=freshwater metagenome TaxID=449393 RepID=A0A6J6HP69_9ZZZZ|nr:GNAT family N-acetyltransferase [Actinomycetota bacterium]MSZ96080.1 GNAT family N-acetyltransferase [Actinomycetota bacterium]
MRTVSRAPELLVVGDYVVRKYEEDDASALMRAVTESLDHLLPWMPWAKFEPQSVEQRKALIREWDAEWRNHSNFVMGIFKGERVVGGTGFHLRGDNGSIEIGYWLHVDFVGQGIAVQVTSALTKCAFATWPEISVVEIVHDQANKNSRRIPESLGFLLVDQYERVAEAPGEVGVCMRWHMTREGS